MLRLVVLAAACAALASPASAQMLHRFSTPNLPPVQLRYSRFTPIDSTGRPLASRSETIGTAVQGVPVGVVSSTESYARPELVVRLPDGRHGKVSSTTVRSEPAMEASRQEALARLSAIETDTFYVATSQGARTGPSPEPAYWYATITPGTPLFVLGTHDSLSYVVESTQDVREEVEGRTYELSNPAFLQTYEARWVRSRDLARGRLGLATAQIRQRQAEERQTAKVQRALDSLRTLNRRDVRRERAAGREVLITEIQATGDDTHTGADFSFALAPSSRINYLRLTVLPYDRVGHVVPRSILGGQKEFTVVGPWEAADEFFEGSVSYDYAWWQGIITCLRVTRLRVEYANGRVRTYTGNALAGLIRGGESNSCAN